MPPPPQGLLDVVAASLLGSILSNLLLVLGCCFLLGGARYEVQSFNQLATRVGARHICHCYCCHCYCCHCYCHG